MAITEKCQGLPVRLWENDESSARMKATREMATQITRKKKTNTARRAGSEIPRTRPPVENNLLGEVSTARIG